MCVHHSSGLRQFRDPECYLVHPVPADVGFALRLRPEINSEVSHNSHPSTGMASPPRSEDTSKASSGQPVTSWLKSLGLPPTYRKKSLTSAPHPHSAPGSPPTLSSSRMRSSAPNYTWNSNPPCLDISLCFCFFCKPQPFQGNLAQGLYCTANSIRNVNSQRQEPPCSTMPKCRSCSIRDTTNEFWSIQIMCYAV